MNPESEGDFTSLRCVSLAATFGSLLPWMTNALPAELGRLWSPVGGNDNESTDRERLEVAIAALHLSERLVRQFFDESPIGVAVLDPAGRLLQFNRAFTALMGCAMEDLMQRNFEDLVHPRDAAAVREHRRRLVEGRSEEFQLDVRFATAARPEVWTRMAARLERLGRDQAPCVFAHIIEVPEFRHRERWRRHAEEAAVKGSDPDRYV